MVAPRATPEPRNRAPPDGRSQQPPRRGRARAMKALLFLQRRASRRNKIKKPLRAPSLLQPHARAAAKSCIERDGRTDGAAGGSLGTGAFWFDGCWVFPAFLFPNRSAAEGKGEGEAKGKKKNIIQRNRWGGDACAWDCVTSDNGRKRGSGERESRARKGRGRLEETGIYSLPCRRALFSPINK